MNPINFKKLILAYKNLWDSLSELADIGFDLYGEGKYLSTPCDHNDGTCPNWVPSIKDRMLTLEKI